MHSFISATAVVFKGDVEQTLSSMAETLLRGVEAKQECQRGRDRGVDASLYRYML
jgi:hypothetical protein